MYGSTKPRDGKSTPCMNGHLKMRDPCSRNTYITTVPGKKRAGEGRELAI